MHKFIEIKKSDSSNYLNSGYFVVTNTSGDWIHLTNNLHYVRKNAVVAVSELDASLLKQETRGLVHIDRPAENSSGVEDATVEPAAETQPKKSKKAAKALEEVLTQAVVEASPEVDETVDNQSLPPVENTEETAANDVSADENKDSEVQETA